jgi:hypothetical protein
MYEVQPLI